MPSPIVRSVRNAGIVTRPAPPPEAQELADKVSAELQKKGVGVWRGVVPDEGEFIRSVPDLDLVFAFGGDGTILHVAKAGSVCGVPVVGVDFGRFGFLAELSQEETLDSLPRFLKGDFWVEERAMLVADVMRHGESVKSEVALNDVVVGRNSLGGVIEVTVLGEDEYITTYVGDGVIIATATGSTAYNIAAGGPILHPTLRNMVVTPIAPHLTHLRATVLPEDQRVSLRVGTRNGGKVGFDGSVEFTLEDQDVLNIRVSPEVSYFARIQPKTYFYKTLTDRLRRGG